MEFLMSNWKEILLAIAGLFAVGFTVKLIRNRDSNKVVQKGNVVYGDQAGRDINKK